MIMASQGDDMCEFLHEYDPSRMEFCQFFINNGMCNAGADCPFRHPNQEELEKHKRRDECVNYARGFCKFGSACRYKHVRKPCICPDYLAGFCSQGTKCKHAQF